MNPTLEYVRRKPGRERVSLGFVLVFILPGAVLCLVLLSVIGTSAAGIDAPKLVVAGWEIMGLLSWLLAGPACVAIQSANRGRRKSVWVWTGILINAIPFFFVWLAAVAMIVWGLWLEAD
jgi:hypothetical protein